MASEHREVPQQRGEDHPPLRAGFAQPTEPSAAQTSQPHNTGTPSTIVAQEPEQRTPFGDNYHPFIAQYPPQPFHNPQFDHMSQFAYNHQVAQNFQQHPLLPPPGYHQVPNPNFNFNPPNFPHQQATQQGAPHLPPQGSSAPEQPASSAAVVHRSMQFPNGPAYARQDQAQPPARPFRQGGFRPSAMVLPLVRARRDNPTPEDIRRRVEAGVSARYAGDYTLAVNRPANIPQEENCSVWISGLPADITTYELLGAVRDTGRVWASHIKRPEGKFVTSGAKITFFKAVAAQTFLQRHAGPAGRPLIIRGHAARVEADRNRVAEPSAPEDHTRVIMIYGPKEVVNEEFLTDYFTRNWEYQTDEVVQLVAGACVNMLEWRFGSYRCQALSAWLALQRDELFRSHGVTVRFSRDPCDV